MFYFLLKVGSRMQNAKSELALLEGDDDDDDDDDDEQHEAPTRAQVIRNAILYLIAGATVAAVFADPLVSAIGGFSKASGISPFFISFIATPLATNSSEAISSLIFARRKRKRNISMTYSQVRRAFLHVPFLLYLATITLLENCLKASFHRS